MIWSSWQVILFLVGTGLSWLLFEYALHKNRQLIDAETTEAGWKKAVSVHPMLEKLMPFDKYLKSVAYAKVNALFGFCSRNFDRLCSFAVLALCIYPVLFSIAGTCMPLALVIVASIMAIVDWILAAPFEAYDTFKIEEDFGFNTQTTSTWCIDKLKELGINIAISSVSLLAMYYGIKLFLAWTGANIQSWSFIIAMTVGASLLSLCYEALYINVIAPLFNKFTPLQDKELDSRIKQILNAKGFSVSGIYVMDASRRSKHGNAYFTGFGKMKRIVLFDVLLKTHTADEILAILAHETGHLVHRDILKWRISSALMTALTTFLTVMLISTPDIYNAFGFSCVNNGNISEWYVVGFYLAETVLGAVLWPLDLLSSINSRKQEYAADAFAKEAVGAEPMKTGLIKLYADSLSNPHTHPLLEFCYYGHPTLLHRLEALSK